MKKAIVIIIAILTLHSCSKSFLNETNPNTLSESTYWQSAEDVDRALTGCYSALQNAQLYNGSTDYATGGVIRLEVVSDNGYANWDYIDGGSVARGDYSPTDGYVSDLWTGCYRLISRCNDFLANVDRVTEVAEDSRNTMKSEVRFLRALAYQVLAMAYRDVPLITKTQTLAESKVPKNSNEELNTFIVNELKDISSGTTLPVRAASVGRVERGAALALLAREYLYTKQYTEAAAAAKQVMDLTRYDLKTPYNVLFTQAGEKSNGIIFRVAYAGPGLGVGAAYAGYFKPVPPVGYVALPNLADDFYFKDGMPKATSTMYDPSDELLNRDPRFDATLLCTSSLFMGKAIKASDLTPTGYRVRKFTDEAATSNFDTGQDFYVIRYAEVLLMRAEALVESGSYDEGEVDNLIDQVRARVNMPSVESVEGTGLSATNLTNLIRHERRVETAFEGLRFFDLKRWGNYEAEAVDKYMAYDKPLAPAIQNRLNIGAKHALFPIPQRELDVNRALVQASEWK